MPGKAPELNYYTIAKKRLPPFTKSESICGRMLFALEVFFGG
jgi:hypothetical protein